MTQFKLQKTVIIILIGIGAAVAINKAMQPDVGYLKFVAKGDVAYGYGQTDARSVNTASRFFRENPQVKTFVLKKMPGTSDIDMNFRIGRRIRASGIDTHLDKNSYIASGAVDLFLSGNKRTMECGAMIGVHSWSGGPKYHPARLKRDPRQKIQEAFLVEMGIDPAFYAFTRDAALPDDMYYLSAAEIEKFGLLTQPADCG